MTDVFISYASEDRERARQLASALKTRGWSVWWDRKIIAGQTFDEVIEHELDTAKCVVVLWSNNSISSEWVKNEAAVGAERGVLVPALIDNVKLPLEFRRKQTANLVGWNGAPAHGGFQTLCDGIATKLNITDLSQGQPAISPGPKLRLHGRLTLFTATSIGIVGVFIILFQAGVFDRNVKISKSEGPPDPQPTTVLRSNQDQVLDYRFISEGPGLIVFEVDYRYDPAHNRKMFVRVIVYSDAEPAESGQRSRRKRIAEGLSEPLTQQEGKVRVDARKLLGEPTESGFIEVTLLEQTIPLNVKQFPFRRRWGPA